MPLTDVRARNAKSQAKPAKLSDGGGLHLLVTPQGSKLWRFAYRFDGKQKPLAIGSYPDITLEQAREARANAQRHRSEQLDPAPAELKKIERRQKRFAAENTFQVVSQEWFEKMRREGRASTTLAKTDWLLNIAYPQLGQRPVADISSAEVLEVLRTVENREMFETARRLRSTIGSVFRYAIATLPSCAALHRATGFQGRLRATIPPFSERTREGFAAVGI